MLELSEASECCTEWVFGGADKCCDVVSGKIAVLTIVMKQNAVTVVILTHIERAADGIILGTEVRFLPEQSNESSAVMVHWESV